MTDRCGFQIYLKRTTPSDRSTNVMRTRIFSFAMLFATISIGGVMLANGQVEVNQLNSPQSVVKVPADARPNMLAQLGLARDQIQQIRRLNMERKPLMQAAQLRLRDASRLLDEAIYADNADDALVEVRLKEAQSAQAEVQRIRYTSELSIRKILTPDQLVRFREMRQRFEGSKIRQEIVNRRQNGTVTTPTSNEPIRQYLKQKRQRAVQ